MRVSTYPTDSGYLNYLRGWKGCKVYLDGREVSMVFMADEQLGEVVRAKLNDEGRPYLDGDKVATELLRGVVQIVK